MCLFILHNLDGTYLSIKVTASESGVGMEIAVTKELQ